MVRDYSQRVVGMAVLLSVIADGELHEDAESSLRPQPSLVRGLSDGLLVLWGEVESLIRFSRPQQGIGDDSRPITHVDKPAKECPVQRCAPMDRTDEGYRCVGGMVKPGNSVCHVQ